MLDPHLIRNDLGAVAKRLAIRGFTLETEKLRELEAARKTIQEATQDLQNQRNTASKTIGQKKVAGESVDEIMAEVAGLGDQLKAKEQELKTIQDSLHAILAGVPNLPHDSVPEGQTEDDNREERTVGNPRTFDFTPKDHVDVGESLGTLDFEQASKITGSRFVTLHGSLAKLHRALTQFMLDTHTEHHGYTEVYVPYIVNEDSLFGTGQLPKFKEDLFALNGEHDYYLIPTAEVPVTNLVRDKILSEDELPLKFVCHTPCFRSEAGSYGKDTRGMIRQHQFEKVELVQIVPTDASYDALEALTGHAEAILQQLNLPYRVVTLCGGDLGFSSAKTYDLEVWLPSQNTYREISSCSNFESFQARRMAARYKTKDSKKPMYAHTLNGSGLAVGRTLLAILENYQQADGTVVIPDVLRPYMGGKEIL